MPDLRVPELVAALDRACRAAGFDDFMPSAMIGHFVRQVTPSSLEGDRFLLNQFYQWVRQEYSIPDSAFGRAFNLFGPDAARIGVTVVEPPAFDPGFGETIRSWLIGVVDGDQAQATAATAMPQIPIADIEQTEVMPADYELPMDPVAAPAGEPIQYGEPVTDDSAEYATPEEEMQPTAPTEAAADEAVTYGTPVDEPATYEPAGEESSPVEVLSAEPFDMAPAGDAAAVDAREPDREESSLATDTPTEIAVPIDDSAIMAEDAEAVPALVIEPSAEGAAVLAAEPDPVPSESRSYVSPEAELEALRAEVAEELRRELWPVVYDEVRALVTSQVRPALEAEIRERLEVELRPEVERVLAVDVREELYARLHEEVAAELRASEHAPVAADVRGRIEDAVREELRRELWTEVRQEVKEDLRSVMLPALEAEVREEAGCRPRPDDQIEELTLADFGGGEPEPAPAAAHPVPEDDAERGLGLGADDQLLIIRRLRERLAPAIREQFARELSDLACCLREAETEKERERRLSDPEYCREQVRQYFFPDQPALWERIRPHVDPDRWGELVRALSRGAYDRDRLERARPVVREALMLKAEIDGEMGSAPPRGIARPRALAEALSGADRALDFALDSINATINGI